MAHMIAYYRVSTTRQGRSGLGLEAQKQAVESYCKLNDRILLTEMTEVRSTRKRQAILEEAIELCRQFKATLIVARLDRLGRDVELIAGIVKHIEVAVADNPHANRFTIHILAAVAEEQRQKISESTKSALAAAKQRGVVLGKYGKVLALMNKASADEFADKIRPILDKLRNKGTRTVRAITAALNKKGIPTYRGEGKWYQGTVHALLKRLDKGTAHSFS